MFDANFLNQENKSNNKKKKSAKTLLICIDFNVTFKKFSCGDTPGIPQKTGFRSINGREAPVLLRHSDTPPPPNFSRSATEAYAYIQGLIMLG